MGEDLLKSLDMPHLFPRIVAKGVTLTPQTMVDRIDPGTATIAFLWRSSASR